MGKIEYLKKLSRTYILEEISSILDLLFTRKKGSPNKANSTMKTLVSSMPLAPPATPTIS